MPVRAAGDEDRLVGVALEPHPHLGLGLGHRGGLDRLALAVERVEPGGDAGGLDRVLAEQQPGAERRIADAPAGIDPGAEQEAEMPGLRRLPEAGRVEEGGQAAPAAAAHHREALAHEGPVEAVQRHHVGDGGERHEVEPAIRSGMASPSRRRRRLSATRVRKTTPAAQRWPRPEMSSRRFGLTRARTGGSTSGAP